MVTRVTTPGNYATVLSNLLAAQQRQQDAGNKVSTGKNGSDLKDFAQSAELLTGMRSLQTRLVTFQDQNKQVADKLSTQDTALTGVASAAANIREIMSEALASGRVDTLVEDIQQQMGDAVENMNARYNGQYVFAGGQVDTRPVTATQLSDLTTPPAVIANFFKNDNFKAQAKVDESTSVTTGVLASDIGTAFLTQLQTFEQFNQGGSGPFQGQMTAAQKTFLEGQLASWDQIRSDVTDITAHNGNNAKRVDTISADLGGRTDSLTGMIGDITDADMGAAAAALQQAQLSVQAAAYVFQGLQSSSLINLLK
ncbi:MAG: flagellin [Caulobacterales bacterium]|nr:flagellin [Caulobacterales bacterium]